MITFGRSLERTHWPYNRNIPAVHALTRQTICQNQGILSSLLHFYDVLKIKLDIG
jgi:hypothetical protein